MSSWTCARAPQGMAALRTPIHQLRQQVHLRTAPKLLGSSVSLVSEREMSWIRRWAGNFFLRACHWTAEGLSWSLARIYELLWLRPHSFCGLPSGSGGAMVSSISCRRCFSAPLPRAHCGAHQRSSQCPSAQCLCAFSDGEFPIRISPRSPSCVDGFSSLQHSRCRLSRGHGSHTVIYMASHLGRISSMFPWCSDLMAHPKAGCGRPDCSSLWMRLKAS